MYVCVGNILTTVPPKRKNIELSNFIEIVDFAYRSGFQILIKIGKPEVGIAKPEIGSKVNISKKVPTLFFNLAA